MGLFVRDQGAGDGFDHDNKYGSFSSPQDRKIATLRYQAAAADHYYRNVRHMAAAQSAEIANNMPDTDDDTVTGLGGPRRKRQTLATVDVTAMPDQPDYQDIDIGLQRSFTDYWTDETVSHEASGTWGSHAPSGKVPSQMHFTDGSTGPKIRRYKRPRHLQDDIDRVEARIGGPVVRYSDEELARLRLVKSTSPADLGLLF
jgi:hypothetical protein